jgi:hypothetical protein
MSPHPTSLSRGRAHGDAARMAVAELLPIDFCSELSSSLAKRVHFSPEQNFTMLICGKTIWLFSIS